MPVEVPAPEGQARHAGQVLGDELSLAGVRIHTPDLASAPSCDVQTSQDVHGQPVVCGIVPEVRDQVLKTLETIREIEEKKEFWRRFAAGERGLSD